MKLANNTLRLRGGGSPSGSPSPSPPATRPASPTEVPSKAPVKSQRQVRPAMSARSRSGRSRLLSLSPDRRHSTSGQARRSRGRTPGRARGRTPGTGNSRRLSPVESASQPVHVGPYPFYCGNNCNAQFSTDRARVTHETFHCRSSQSHKV